MTSGEGQVNMTSGEGQVNMTSGEGQVDDFSGNQYWRAPNIMEPMRTMVEPSSTAIW